MPADDRGGLRAAFSNFKKPEPDEAAELKLLGRRVDPDPTLGETLVPLPTVNYQIDTPKLPGKTGGLSPKPLYQREAVRQLSFRCPLSVAAELRRKANFNQLEQQEIIIEGIRRVLTELSEPPAGWELA